MVQTILRRVLLAEVLMYTALVYALASGDTGGWTIAGLAVSLAFLWRLYLTLVSLVVTRLSGRYTRARPVNCRAAIKAVCREFIARLICFSWSQTFPQLAMGKDPCDSHQGAPILLVHGHFSNRGIWVRFRQRIAAAGLGPIYTISLTPYFGDLDEFAAQLATRIDLICAETRAAQVTLIGHSMGGMVCRRYMTLHSPARIAKLVTLGTPHHGSHFARWLFGKNALQLRIGSDWLGRLARAEVPTQPPPTLSLYSLVDDIIDPPDSSVLAWARNVPVTAVGHVGLVFSEVVANEVIQFLLQADRHVTSSTPTIIQT